MRESEGNNSICNSASAETRTSTTAKGQHRGKKWKKNTNGSRSQSKFEGSLDALQGFIYDCTIYDLAYIYSVTTKEVAWYIRMNCEYGHDAATAILNLTEPTFELPEKPYADATRTKELIWESETKTYYKRKIRYRENMNKTFSIVWGQCSDIMRSKLSDKRDYKERDSEANGLELLKDIKEITHSSHYQQFHLMALLEANRRFYTFRQGRNMSVSDYFSEFKKRLDEIEYYGGTLINDKLIAEELDGRNIDEASPEELEKARTSAKEGYVACAFLLSSDKERFGSLIIKLENNYLQKVNSYPRTLNKALDLLLYWKYD